MKNEKTLEKQTHNYAMLISVIVVIAIISLLIAFYRPDQPIPTTTTLPSIQEPSVTTTMTTTTTQQEASLDTLPPQPVSKEHIVKIQNFRFVPEKLTIDVGDTVTWINQDVRRGHVRPHIVNAHYQEFRSERLYENDTFSHTFETPGTYTYIDAVFTNQVRVATIYVVENAITGNFARNLPKSANPMVVVLSLVMLAGMVTGYVLGFKE